MENLDVNYRDIDINERDQANEIALIGRALSSPIRVEILRMIIKKPLLLSEISKILGLQISSATFHLKVLEDANLVCTHFSTKGKMSLKYYSYSNYKLIRIFMRDTENKNEIKNQPYRTFIKIGDYVDAKFNKMSGMATEAKQIAGNMPQDAFINERHNAQIIWNSNDAYLTYAIANSYACFKKVTSISFSLEICAEAYGYNHDFPSDITFSVNGVELATYTCKGDFGDRYGKYTPTWWFVESTKYGELVTVSVTDEGVYINDKLVNRNVSVRSLNLSEGNRTEIKIEVKEDAVRCGGFNIFGEKFGDYNQHIVFSANYD